VGKVLESQRESQIDTCVECIKEGDKSQKLVYQCKLCQRWLCEKHIEPKLAFIKTNSTDSAKLRELLERDKCREDGHPDFQYSRETFEKLEMEERRRQQLIKEAFDKMKGHYKGGPSIPTFTRKLPKEEWSPKPRRSLPVGRILGALMILVILGVFLWYGPAIVSMFQTLFSHNQSQSEASYTSLTLREGMNNTAVIKFGDTEYDFAYYYGGSLSVSTFLEETPKIYTPHKGDIYSDYGIEVKISDISSDYISNYIVILVKPTAADYSASLHYTKVSVALGETKTVNISSGLINKTNQYGFSFWQNKYQIHVQSCLGISLHNDSTNTYFGGTFYDIFAGETIKDFEVEIRIFKIESDLLIIYVKPLY
jgi:hypothetical protein